MQFEVRIWRQSEIVSLNLEAVDEADARAKLAAQSAQAISVKPKASPWRMPVAMRHNDFSVLLFSQELLALLEAGLGIVEAIDTLAEKERRPPIRAKLLGIAHSLAQGKSFSSALESLEGVFPPLYVGIIRAAERTSNLVATLTRYIDYETRLSAVRSKVIGAAVYPVILLAVGAAVTIFLAGFVVPRFASVYHGTGRQLPAASAALLSWGVFVAANGMTVLYAALAACVSIALGLKLVYERIGFLGLIERLPGIAEHARLYGLSRFYLSLGMLLDGGMPIVTALSMARSVVGPELRERISNASIEIQNGESLSTAFERFGLVTTISQRFLRVGERAGNLGEMLGRSARYHDGEIARWIDWFTRAFEPLLMAAIGLVVGTIVVLLYLPIFDLAGSFQ